MGRPSSRTPATTGRTASRSSRSSPALRALDLDGVELDYPYAASSPELFPDGDAERFAAALRAAGEALSLRFTRGSDAHGLADLDRIYGKVPA